MVESEAAVLSQLSEELCARAVAFASDAYLVGFPFFACDIKSNLRGAPIRLQFADGTGDFFERTLRLRMVSIKKGLWLSPEQKIGIMDAVRSRVLNLNGVQSIVHGMKRRRIPAKVP